MFSLCTVPVPFTHYALNRATGSDSTSNRCFGPRKYRKRSRARWPPARLRAITAICPHSLTVRCTGVDIGTSRLEYIPTPTYRCVEFCRTVPCPTLPAIRPPGLHHWYQIPHNFPLTWEGTKRPKTNVQKNGLVVLGLTEVVAGNAVVYRKSPLCS